MRESHRIRRPPSLHARSFSAPHSIPVSLIVHSDRAFAEFLAGLVRNVWRAAKSSAAFARQEMSVVITSALGDGRDGNALQLMESQPAYVLVDAELRDSKGMQTLEKLIAFRGNHPARIGIFFRNPDAAVVRTARRTGASAVFPSELPEAELAAAVKMFIERGTWLPLSVLGSRD